MRWSEPQLAMLREMGLRLWLAPPPAANAAPPMAAAALPTAAAVMPIAAAAAPVPVASVATPLATPLATPPATPLAAPAGVAVARPEALPVAGPAPTVTPAVKPPALIDASSLAWPALRDAVAACRACSLCETRRQTVFGVGHPQAHCMIVGEAPGETEDARGEPFVGESGQLLDRMLRAIGLGRLPADPPDPNQAADPARQVFIANALKCRPPRNRNPTPQELATCQPYLERQVALVQPRVIIAMGRFAVQSLLGSDEPIGKLRGRVHRWRGAPLVVTYHPAYLLRQPAEKARAWDDLCLAAACLDGAAG